MHAPPPIGEVVGPPTSPSWAPSTSASPPFALLGPPLCPAIRAVCSGSGFLGGFLRTTSTLLGPYPPPVPHLLLLCPGGPANRVVYPQQVREALTATARNLQ